MPLKDDGEIPRCFRVIRRRGHTVPFHPLRDVRVNIAHRSVQKRPRGYPGSSLYSAAAAACTASCAECREHHSRSTLYTYSPVPGDVVVAAILRSDGRARVAEEDGFGSECACVRVVADAKCQLTRQVSDRLRYGLGSHRRWSRPRQSAEHPFARRPVDDDSAAGRPTMFGTASQRATFIS